MSSRPLSLFVLAALALGDPLARADAPASAPAATPAAAAPATVDPVALQREYDDAVAAFGRGDQARAANEFDDVAARSVDPSRRATAARMASRARALGGASVAAPASAPVAAAPAPVLDQSGRLRLVSATTALGLAVWGPATLGMIQPGDSRLDVGLYTLVAGAGFAVPYLVTRGEEVTRGMAVLAGSGGLLGAGSGLLLDCVLSACHSASSRGPWGAALGLSLAGTVGGALWAKETHMSDGKAATISSGAFYGAGWGLGASVLLGLDDTSAARRLLPAGTLIGIAGGALAGDWLADHRTYTLGDAGVVSLTPLLGAYLAATPLVWMGHHLSQEAEESVVTAVLLGGSALGFLAGDRLVAGKDVTEDQSGFLALGALAGGLVGLGATYVLLPRSTSSSTQGKLYMTDSAVGLVAGFALTWLSLDVAAEAPRGSSVAWQLAPYVGPRGQAGALVAGTF